VQALRLNGCHSQSLGLFQCNLKFLSGGLIKPLPPQCLTMLQVSRSLRSGVSSRLRQADRPAGMCRRLAVIAGDFGIMRSPQRHFSLPSGVAQCVGNLLKRI